MYQIPLLGMLRCGEIPAGGSQMSTTELTYTVPGMSCDHCKAAVSGEVDKVEGVEAVEVDLDTKKVVVRGTGVSDDAVRAAIDEAGYEVAAS
jgi:copper chaperone